ncbi:MAG: hypothetical protein KatS3mg111_1664 [Pirellulaceae bacterium]|nr:MAG: hypothetical protein KatS3mg111_1664 [Pirellulaceae bacterium]
MDSNALQRVEGHAEAESSNGGQDMVPGKVTAKWWLLPIMLVVPAAIVFLLMDQWYPFFYTNEGADDLGYLPPQLQQRLDRKNVVVLMSLLGGVLGISLSWVECLLQKSCRVRLAWLPVVAVSSVVAGAFGGLAGHELHVALARSHSMSELMKAVLTNLALLGPMLAGIGAILTFVVSADKRTSLVGLLSGALAGVLIASVYPVAVALLFPRALTTALIPLESAERVLWLALCFLGAPIIIVLAMHSRQPSVRPR